MLLHIIYVCGCLWNIHTAIPEDMIQEPEPTEDDPEERIPREFNIQMNPSY